VACCIIVEEFVPKLIEEWNQHSAEVERQGVLLPILTDLLLACRTAFQNGNLFSN
jgi:hypothetical protein